MEGERKKRKTDDHAVVAVAVAEEAEENEEEKMEKFFALIRSTRDIKERLSLMTSNVDKSSKSALLQEEGGVTVGRNKLPPPPVAVWNPTFLPEDFMEDHPHHHPENPIDLNIPNTTHDETAVVEAGPSENTKTVEETRDDNGGGGGEGVYRDLDLNLSL